MRSITVNLSPELKEELHALSIIRGTSMEEIAYAAMRGYIATPIEKHEVTRRRDKDATRTWFIRLTDEMQAQLEARALQEIGAPSSPEGTPGRKTYKATIIRRALRWYIDRISPEEYEAITEQRSILDAARSRETERIGAA